MLAQRGVVSLNTFTMTMPYHERQSQLSAALHASNEALRIPEVAQRLGAYAADLLRIQSRIVTPDLEDDVIVLDDYQSNAIPAVALHMGERVLRRPQDMLFDAEQRYHINKKYKSGLSRDIFSAFANLYRERDEYTEVSILAPKIAALVTSDMVGPEEDAWQIYMRGRPIVAFNLDIEESHSMLNIIHEQTHLFQIMREPLSPTNFDDPGYCLRSELEAYHVAAQTIYGYAAAGRVNDLDTSDAANNFAVQTIMIEDARLRHQMPGKSPFAVSQALIDDLHANNLYILGADVIKESAEQ